MKKKLLLFLILSVVITLSAKADFALSDGTDFTGESFFEAPSQSVSTRESDASNSTNQKHTIPPIKLLRLYLQDKQNQKDMKNFEFAPMQKEPDIYSHSETGASKYASQEIKDNFEEVSPDGFDADEETIIEKNRKGAFADKNVSKDSDETQENIILDCDNIDYDTPNYLIKATGNVNIEFVKQKAFIKADTLTFDRVNNTIKAEGNVKIIKHGQTITGDYIFVDLNEENALIENPISTSHNMEIHAQKGYVYGDKIVQENGELTVNGSYPINFISNKRTARISQMLTPKKDTLSENIENGIIKFRADDIKIKQKGDLEVISIKKGKLSKGERTLFKIPAIKIYTNKNHDYAETNFYEVGFYRGLGLYTGPGWVFELPKGSVLKAIPILNYKSGFGIGGLGRFSSGTNVTTVAYGTASSKFFVYGRQELDDHLFMQYSVNSYMDEWFLGRRRPKYGASLVYNNSYSSEGFLLPKLTSSFNHRLEAGYFQDLDFDSGHEKIKSSGNMGTTRFRYMAEVKQGLFDYKNPEKLQSVSFDLLSQLSAAIYGTGDTQTVFRFGPTLRLQYRRWMQDIFYSFNAYDDNSPMARFDSFRYGSQTLSLREYFRICKWLTVSWFGSICTTNDTINGRKIPENAFYLSFGPDDFKFHIGYDFERQNLKTVVEVMMDAKGTNVEYKTFELKQEEKSKKENRPTENKRLNANAAPTQPKVLQRAIVEDIKVMEDVL